MRDPYNLIAFIKANPGFDFYIDATTFTQDRGWAKEVCERLSSLDKPIRWKTVTRVDQLDNEIIGLMRSSGCYKIGFGVETMAGRLQQKIRKNVSADSIEEGVNLLNRHGITPRAFLILGIPGQTARDVRETKSYLDSLETEQRWKEYVPFERIPSMSDIEQFAEFERNTHKFHHIPGLSKEEYVSLLETKR